MVNLSDLERKLNSDSKLREEFFKDPVNALQREGLFLSLEQQFALRQSVAALTNKTPLISGSSIGVKLAWEIF